MKDRYEYLDNNGDLIKDGFKYTTEHITKAYTQDRIVGESDEDRYKRLNEAYRVSIGC